jgi:hypothetical protein
MFSQPHRLDVKRSQGHQQQQAQRPDNRAQQQGGTTPELQPRQAAAQTPDKPAQQMGEGSYEGTRDYQEKIKTYLDKADVKSDAEAAKPATPEEAAALKKAEDEALSHTKAPGQ